jgi:hypothetical protein
VVPCEDVTESGNEEEGHEEDVESGRNEEDVDDTEAGNEEEGLKENVEGTEAGLHTCTNLELRDMIITAPSNLHFCNPAYPSPGHNRNAAPPQY